MQPPVGMKRGEERDAVPERHGQGFWHEVGERVTRENVLGKPQHGLSHGTIVRRYSSLSIHQTLGYYPELYDVQWDEGSRIRESGRGYFGFGIDKETSAAKAA